MSAHIRSHFGSRLSTAHVPQPTFRLQCSGDARTSTAPISPRLGKFAIFASSMCGLSTIRKRLRIRPTSKRSFHHSRLSLQLLRKRELRGAALHPQSPSPRRLCQSLTSDVFRVQSSWTSWRAARGQVTLETHRRPIILRTLETHWRDDTSQ